MMTRIPLGSICEGKIPTINAQYNGVIDYIDISSVDNIQKKIVSKQTLLSSEAPSRAKQILRNGDIIVSTVRPNLNAVALVDVDTDNLLVGSTGYCVLRCKEECDRKFVFYFCQSPYFVDDMDKQATGASYPAVSGNIVKASLVPNYDVSTKHRIVTHLDEVTRLISLQKEQLSKLDELVKSRFIELFGDILHDKSIETIPLSHLADVGSSKRIYANEYVNSGIPFYRSKEIRELGQGQKPTTELFISTKRYEEIRQKYGVPKNGDILIAAIGATIGYSWIVDTDQPFYYKDGNLILLSIKSGVNSIFLNYVMSILIEDYKSNGASGSAQLALTIEKLEKMMIPFPKIENQIAFASLVKQIDKLKFEVKQSLEKLETLKKSLMQEYFG